MILDKHITDIKMTYIHKIIDIGHYCLYFEF